MVKAVANLEWGIDLSDLDSGDPFKILLEAVQRGQKIIEYKALLAAEVVNQGQTFTAFLLPEERRHRQKKRFEEEYKGVGLDIESEGQKFLRFPLEFSRISSSFSLSRFHPILHRARRHNGIDFAAPRGTPVYSVAKGLITFIGRQSGYGNIVKIDHPGPYETAYAHLQGFADGIEEGAEIEKGRVVGYVGSTGLATGPHLHFELLKDGTFVNPFNESTDDITVTQEEEPTPVDPVIEAKKKSLTEKLATLEVGSKLLTSIVIPQQRGLVANTINNRQRDTHQQASSGENVQR
jgi:murein DD-endopeptidase MepM/ murein hydrolase activator NlpD